MIAAPQQLNQRRKQGQTMNVDSDIPRGLEPLQDMPENGRQVLTTAEGTPRLMGSECSVCRTRFFPARTICFTCMSDDLTDVALAREGSLYSTTAVHVSATRETPYTIGFVDLTDGVRVLSTIATDPLPDLDTTVQLETGNDQWWFGSVSREEKTK
jgi:uncharacterized OB-fold protein